MKQYIVNGTVNVYAVHKDPENGTEYETILETKGRFYNVEAEYWSEAVRKAAREALGTHVDTTYLSLDEENSVPKHGHSAYEVMGKKNLYRFEGVAFERAGE